MVITGGYNANLVTVYDMYGFVAQLPDITEGRQGHGCGYYRNDNDQIVSYKFLLDIIQLDWTCYI